MRPVYWASPIKCIPPSRGESMSVWDDESFACAGSEGDEASLQPRHTRGDQALYEQRQLLLVFREQGVIRPPKRGGSACVMTNPHCMMQSASSWHSMRTVSFSERSRSVEKCRP